VDNVSIAMFEANLEPNLRALLRDLKEGTFQPRPARRVFIDKGGGKLRPLGIPTVRDRIAQEVLRRLLSPLYEPLFHHDSYGFRPQRSTHDAIDRVRELHRQGYRHVLDADIKGFFDAIPHAVVMRGLRHVVADGNILRLVERFLKAGVLEAGSFQPTTVGTPQGGVISPLLANLALNFLDWRLEAAGWRFVRYADDFVVLCRSKRQAQEAQESVQAILGELGLTLSPEKTKVTTFQEGFDFLGFRLGAQTMTARLQSVEKFKDRVREVTRRSHNLDATVIGRLNAIVRGFARYFAIPGSTCVLQFRKLDEWLRRRLRCMRYKRKSDHDNHRMPIRHLRRRGTWFLSDYLPGARSGGNGFPARGNFSGVARCGKAACR
jgi:group II intron reverse transcriptase/maturase